MCARGTGGRRVAVMVSRLCALAHRPMMPRLIDHDQGSGILKDSVLRVSDARPESDHRSQTRSLAIQCRCRNSILLPVAGGHDIGLDSIISGLGGKALCHYSLVEGTGGAITVVPPDAENDGALFLHRGVTPRPLAIPIDL